MNVLEGTRRMGHLANIMLTLSLVTLLLSFSLSVGLFVGGWLVYGLAYVMAGFADGPGSQIPPPQPRLNA